MSHPFCIRLPFLHAALSGGALAGACHFWPGHAQMERAQNYWMPENLPLSSVFLGSFLEYLANADLTELERIRLLLPCEDAGRQVSDSHELAALAKFRENGDIASGPQDSDWLERRKAQLFLVWTWLQEERLLELARLENGCARIGERLLNILWEDCEVWDLPPDRPAAPDLSLLPDWRMLCGHALRFIPPELPVLIEGPMRSELLAAADWRPLRELAELREALPGRFVGVKASFRELSGTGRGDAPARLWLMRQED